MLYYYISNKMLNRFITYLKERFPVLPLILFASSSIFGMSFALEANPGILESTLTVCFYVLFLLHLRLLDEKKDFLYDNEFHTTRPVQRGLISLKELKLVGIVNLIIISLIGIIISYSLLSMILFFITLSYTFIMCKEFFIHDFYKQSPSLYLLSHQIVFIVLYLYIISNFLGPQLLTLKSILLSVYLTIPILIIELGRKVKHRTSSSGENTNDTYAYIWGSRRTIITICITILVGAIVLYFFNSTYLISSLSLVLFTLLLLIITKYRLTIIVRYSYIISCCIALLLPLSLCIKI